MKRWETGRHLYILKIVRVGWGWMDGVGRCEEFEILGRNDEDAVMSELISVESGGLSRLVEVVSYLGTEVEEVK